MSIKNTSEKDLNKLLSKKKFKKIFVMTGKNSFHKSGIKKIINFKDPNKIFYFYFKLSLLPEINELKKILVNLNKFKPDLILAIGGGAVLDVAKISNVVDIDKINLLKKKLINYETPGSKKNYPLIAIPTTAGSGSEVTSNAVIYIDKIKYSVESNLLLPDYYFLISKLILNNPFNLKASSGFDAIAQAVESLISVKSNKKSVFYAKKSLILSSQNYLKFVNQPNKPNSDNMILSANLAGKAINISKTTAPHAVSYPFTSLYGVSHGHAVSLTLEKFLFFNFKFKKNSEVNFDLNDRYKIIFKIFKVNNINDLCKKIKLIKKQAKLEDDFKKLGINIYSNIDKILGGINLLRIKNNPIKIYRPDIKKILLDE